MATISRSEQSPAAAISQPALSLAPRRTWPLRLIDLGLAGIIVAGPLCSLGQRPAISDLLICLLATLCGLLWCYHHWSTREAGWRFTGIEPLILFALGLVVLQCQTLSPRLLQVLSPRLSEMLPGARLPMSDWLPPAWNRISLTPYTTRNDLAMLVAGAMFFFVAAQRFRSLNDLRSAIRWVAISGVLLALVGVFESALNTGLFHALLGRSGPAGEWPALAPRGPFATPGHFAHALCLTLPAQMFLFTQRYPHQTEEGAACWPAVAQWLSGHRTTAWGLSLLMTSLVVMLTCSLLSIWTAFLGSVVFLLLYWRKLCWNMRTLGLVAGAVLLAWCVVLMASRVLATAEPVAGTDLEAAGPLAIASQRAAVRAAEYSAIEAFPLLGTGLGSHPDVCWLWYSQPHHGAPFGTWDNSYVRLALETGLTGVGVVALLALISLLWSVQGLWNASTPRSIGLMSAVTVGLTTGLLHAAGDCTLYVTGCVNILVIYAVCAWRMSLMRFCESTGQRLVAARATTFSRWSGVAVAGLILSAGSWMAWCKIPEVAVEPLRKEYRRLSDLALTATAAEAEDISQQRLMVSLRAAEAQPRDPRLQLQAGISCLALFELHQRAAPQGMPLARVKDLARATIDSPEEMRVWLRSPTVLGAGSQDLEAAYDHFLKSVARSPLHPRPYLELAELAWLQGGSAPQEDFLLTRAVTVRPGDARGRFALGRTLWRAGKYREAMAHWKTGFQLDLEHRSQLINALAQLLPARDVLEQFEPDHASLQQLCSAYKMSDDRGGYHLLLKALARSAVTLAGSLPVSQKEIHWLQAHQCYTELGERANALETAQYAIQINPSSFDAHHALGICLFQSGRYAEAAEQLDWCAKRKPDLPALQQLAREALARSIEIRTPVKVLAEGTETAIR